LKYVKIEPSIRSDRAKEIGNQTNGVRWSKIRRMPFMMPEVIFMIKETVKEARKGFQERRVRVTPSISAMSRLTTTKARKPKPIRR